MTPISHLDPPILEHILLDRRPANIDLANYARVNRIFRQSVQPELSARRELRNRCWAHGMAVDARQSASSLREALGEIDHLERARRPILRLSCGQEVSVHGASATIVAVGGFGAVAVSSSAAMHVLRGWPQTSSIVDVGPLGAGGKGPRRIGDISACEAWICAEIIGPRGSALAIFDCASGAGLGEANGMNLSSRACWQVDALGVTAFRSHEGDHLWQTWTAGEGWADHETLWLADGRFDRAHLEGASLAQSTSRVVFALRRNDMQHGRDHVFYLNERGLRAPWRRLTVDTFLLSLNPSEVFVESLAVNERFLVALCRVARDPWRAAADGARVLRDAAPCARYVRLPLAAPQHADWSGPLEPAAAANNVIALIGPRLLLSMGDTVRMRRLVDGADLGVSRPVEDDKRTAVGADIWSTVVHGVEVVRVAHAADGVRQRI